MCYDIILLCIFSSHLTRRVKHVWEQTVSSITPLDWNGPFKTYTIPPIVQWKRLDNEQDPSGIDKNSTRRTVWWTASVTPKVVNAQMQKARINSLLLIVSFVGTNTTFTCWHSSPGSVKDSHSAYVKEMQSCSSCSVGSRKGSLFSSQGKFISRPQSPRYNLGTWGKSSCEKSSGS